MKKNTFAVATLALGLLFMTAGCETTDYPPSIYDDDETGAALPTITAVDPATEAYGATGDKNLVTITGTNFPGEITEAHVYFGATKGTIRSITNTSIVVEPPAFFDDSLVLKVDAIGAFDFAYYGGKSSPTLYEIKTPITRPGNIGAGDNPVALTINGAGDLFVAYPKAVYMVPASNEDTLINLGALRPSSAPKKMRLAPDGETFIYPVTTVLFTTHIAGDGTTTHALFNLKKTVYDIEFDSNDNLYAIAAEKIWRVDWSSSPMDSTTVLDLGDKLITNARAYNGKMYLWGSENGGDKKLWTVDIDAVNGTLGSSFSEVLNWTSTEYGNSTVNDITFNSDGKLYLATTMYSLLTVDLGSGAIEKVYPNLLTGFELVSMTWGNDNAIYLNNQSIIKEDAKTVYKVVVFEQGAPYHERN